MTHLKDIAEPTSGASWLTWGQAVDDELRTRSAGIWQIDNFPGSTDDDKHVAAWNAARSATVKPTLQYPARTFGPLTTPIATFSGMSAKGPDGAPGTRGLELSSGNLVNHRVRVECGTGTAALFQQTATIQYVSFSDIAWSGSTGAQWWHNTTPASISIYPLHMNNLTFDGFSSVLGNPSNKFTFTQGKIQGQWTVLNYQTTPIHWGGSDNDISAYINSNSPASVAGAGKPIIHWDYMEKTQVTGLLYITAENAWSGNRVEGPVERELRVFGTVAEGRASGNPATWPVWDIRGCHVVLYGPSVNYVIPTNTAGVIVQSGGVLSIYDAHYRKASAADPSLPLVYQTGGILHVSRPLSADGNSIYVRETAGSTKTFAYPTANSYQDW